MIRQLHHFMEDELTQCTSYSHAMGNHSRVPKAVEQAHPTLA